MPDQSHGEANISFYRFKASQVGIDGLVDRGDGDTLFSQLFKTMKQSNDWKEKWRKNKDNNRVFYANF